MKIVFALLALLAFVTLASSISPMEPEDCDEIVVGHFSTYVIIYCRFNFDRKAFIVRDRFKATTYYTLNWGGSLEISSEEEEDVKMMYNFYTKNVPFTYFLQVYASKFNGKVTGYDLETARYLDFDTDRYYRKCIAQFLA